MPVCFETHPQQSSTIRCATCGKQGVIIWEDVTRPDGAGKDLVRIEGAFFERLSAKPPHQIELVCDVCGSAQKSQLQP